MITAARVLVLMAVAVVLAVGVFGHVPVQAEEPPKEGKKMHGLIGKMTAAEGNRDALIAVLLEGTTQMPAV
jgi:hypothetical protein